MSTFVFDAADMHLLKQTPPLAAATVKFCELIESPGAFSAKMIRVRAL